MKEQIWQSRRSKEDFFEALSHLTVTDVPLRKEKRDTDFKLEMSFILRRKNEHDFILKMYHPYLKNSFRKIFCGSVQETDSGCTIRGHARLAWSARIALIGWHIFLATTLVMWGKSLIAAPFSQSALILGVILSAEALIVFLSVVMKEHVKDMIQIVSQAADAE